MLGEFAIIDRYFRDAGVPRADVVLGVGDDGAILRPPAGCDLIAVSDTLVEGVHFPVGSTAQSVGHRALAVNLSDIAAMGAKPAWSLLALTLPQADETWLAGFASGFAALAREHGVALVGGDTTRGPLMIGVQVLGFVPAGEGLRRAGARPGDLVCVSGTPGDAAVGLALLQQSIRVPRGSALEGDAERLRARFEFPTPRLVLGDALRGAASACIDLSDGLVGDIGKLAAASGCHARLDLDRLPRSAALAALTTAGHVAEDVALRAMLAGGDDYELAFTLPREQFEPLRDACQGVELTIIGEIIAASTTERSAVSLVSQDPQRLRNAESLLAAASAGYDHFGS